MRVLQFAAATMRLFISSFLLLSMFTACPKVERGAELGVPAMASGPLITSLQVRPGALSPAFDLDEYTFTLELEAAFVDLEVTTVEGATVTIDKTAGAKQSAFVPVEGRELVVVATRGEARDERRISVTRAIWYGTGNLPPAEVPTFEEPSPFPGARGFGKPVLSSDGRFLATGFGEEHNIWPYLDVYRLDRPRLERVAHLDRAGLTPIAFCRQEECLWVRDDLPDGSGELARQAIFKLTWKDSRVELQTWRAATGDIRLHVLDPDAMEVIEYDPLLPQVSATRPLLPNGVFGARMPLPELSWGGAFGSHVVSADLTWLLHEEVAGGGVLGEGQRPVGEVMVFHRETRTGSWLLTQRLVSPLQSEESQFGRRMKLSDDGAHLFAGLPEAAVLGKEKAGFVAVFERTSQGYVQKAILTAPEPKAYDFFGGTLGGRAPSRVLTLSGSVPWSTWVLDTASVKPGPLLPPQFNRISDDLSVVVSVSINETTGLREWTIWR